MYGHLFYRIKNNMSYQEVAAALGVSTSVIRKLEKDYALKGKAENYQGLIKLYGVAVEDLMISYPAPAKKNVTIASPPPNSIVGRYMNVNAYTLRSQGLRWAFRTRLYVISATSLSLQIST